MFGGRGVIPVFAKTKQSIYKTFGGLVLQAVILAGGLGTRLSEETSLRPKPMVEIGGRPILWHIMKIYHAQGVKRFIVCCGYKGYLIKEFFHNYAMHMSDISINTKDNILTVHANHAEDWTITLVETGQETMTGGRLKRVGQYLTGGEPFYLTYGDGVADIDIPSLTKFHNSHGKEATLTVVQPAARFGAVTIGGNGVVDEFLEKPKSNESWINGGFFVMETSVLTRIDGDSTVLEDQPLRELAANGELCAFKHHGFWQPMDTIREKNLLNDFWNSGKAPWKVW